jgi:ComF family protein
MTTSGAIARTAATALLDALLPPSCGGCGAEGSVLCPACRRSLGERSDEPPGIPLGLPSDVPAPLLQLEWCAAYRGPVRAALRSLKYGGDRRLAGPLGEALARRWAAAGAGGDLLVPVPVHVDRRRQRGYDQAELLARVAGERLGLPAVAVLVRQRATVAQFELDRGARRANVGGAFAVRPGASAAVRDRWIVLVDDVVTTGATLAACAEALLAEGALGVSALTVARER